MLHIRDMLKDVGQYSLIRSNMEPELSVRKRQKHDM